MFKSRIGLSGITTSRIRWADVPRLRSRTMATVAELVDEETISGYKASNYYPAKVGDVIQNEYTIKVKLGYGRYSTAWLCTNKTQSFKTLKISTAGKAQCREARVFEHLLEASATAEHQDDRHHQCFAFEPLGPSLQEFMERRPKKAFHIAEVQWMARHFLTTLDFLHTHQVVHTDLKLDNILLTLPTDQPKILNNFILAEKTSPSPAKITTGGHHVVQSRGMNQSDFTFPILCDLGSAVIGPQPHQGLAQGLPYRAPEVILGADWGEKIDIWSIGAIIWELIFGDRLFGYDTSKDTMASMVRLLGLPPSKLLDRCAHRDDFFDTTGRWKHEEIAHQDLEDRVEMDGEMPQFFHFIRSMLKWDAADRWSASELLKHPWLQNK